jgi:hypothetical protein
MSVNEILAEALRLPPDSRAQLVESIVESLAANIDPALEQDHLRTVRERRDSALSGEQNILPGDEVLRRARSLLQ